MTGWYSGDIIYWWCSS